MFTTLYKRLSKEEFGTIKKNVEEIPSSMKPGSEIPIKSDPEIEKVDLKNTVTLSSLPPIDENETTNTTHHSPSNKPG